MPRSQEGFSLVEVLIALTILSVSLAVFYQAFSIGAKTSHSAQMRSKAAIFAQTLLATKGVSEPLEAGSDSGSSPAGFKWTLEVQEVSPIDQSLTQKLRVFDIVVDTTWDGNGQYKVHTVRAQHVDEK